MLLLDRAIDVRGLYVGLTRATISNHAYVAGDGEDTAIDGSSAPAPPTGSTSPPSSGAASSARASRFERRRCGAYETYPRSPRQTWRVFEDRSFVVVSGPPASGKSTLARPLAERLGLPLVAKDTIKESLLATLGADDLEQSRRLGRASVAVLYAVAAASPVGAVLEGVFFRTFAVHELRRLRGPIVEIFCRCPRNVALSRYRDRSSTRHAGHLDAERVEEELWNDDNAQPIAGGWRVIEVDTTAPVHVDTLVSDIRHALELPDIDVR